MLHERYDVGLVHLLTPNEVSIPLGGERFDLVDGETGEVLRGVTRDEVDAVRHATRSHGEGIQAFCQQRGIPLVQTLTGDPTDVEHLVLTLFRGRGLLK